MTRRKAETATTQEKPTAERPVDANGRMLDGWGLPLSGPARLRALAELDLPDPHDEPGAWPDPMAVPTIGAAPTPVDPAGTEEQPEPAGDAPASQDEDK